MVQFVIIGINKTKMYLQKGERIYIPSPDSLEAIKTGKKGGKKKPEIDPLAMLAAENLTKDKKQTVSQQEEKLGEEGQQEQEGEQPPQEGQEQEPKDEEPHEGQAEKSDEKEGRKSKLK